MAKKNSSDNKQKNRETKGSGVKIFNIVIWVVLLIDGLFGVYFMTNLAKAELYDSFKYESLSAVETMVGNINQVHHEYESGIISETQAREIAIRMVQNGTWNNGKRGFWALEIDGTLLAKVENGDMSQKPGDNIWDWQDADGKYTEREIVAAGRNGGGFTEFRVDNESANNTYVSYSLATDFGFVVDATFDMNYFNSYWESCEMTVFTRNFIINIVCLVILAIIATNCRFMRLFKRKK